MSSPEEGTAQTQLRLLLQPHPYSRAHTEAVKKNRPSMLDLHVNLVPFLDDSSSVRQGDNVEASEEIHRFQSVVSPPAGSHYGL